MNQFLKCIPWKVPKEDSHGEDLCETKLPSEDPGQNLFVELEKIFNS